MELGVVALNMRINVLVKMAVTHTMVPRPNARRTRVLADQDLAVIAEQNEWTTT